MPASAAFTSSRRAGSAPASDRRPQEVLLADLHAVMTQDAVCRGHVKEEVRQRKVRQKNQAGKTQRSIRGLELDLALLGPVDLLGLESVQERDGAGDALLQIGEAHLDIVELRWRLAGEPGRRALGEIAGQLHLAGKREHVRIQTRPEQG